jgi:hypothetical protein
MRTKTVVMRFLSTKLHGFLDYAVGILLIMSPWLFGFAQDGLETILPVMAGTAALIYSIFTDYETGLVKVIPMHVHLILDSAFGAILAASPWLFGFAEYVYLPHLIFGMLEVGVAAITRTIPYVKGESIATRSFPQNRMHDA